ncbi:hypothetical protein OCA23_30280 [Bacillus cereus]|nr:hypothetical protein [Bacillus cereus]
MGEIVPVHEGGGGGKKGKMSKNQKMLFFGGGLAVIGFFLIMKRGGGGVSTSEGEKPDDYYTNYPTMGAHDALMQDNINSMVDNQMAFFDAVAEKIGAKPPSTMAQVHLVYDNENAVLDAQNKMVSLGVSSSSANKIWLDDGWKGKGWYYSLDGYMADKDAAAEVAAQGKKKGYWQAVSVETVKTNDTPQSGTHVIKWNRGQS